MKEEKGKYIIIYPLYFDTKKSRKKGRKVPKKLSVRNPDLRKLFQIAQRLNLNPILEENKRHPRTWFTEKGRLKVKKVQSKTYILKLIGEKLVKQG